MHDLPTVVIRRPDWKKWAHIPSVGLKSAVSLSLDIEPGCIEKLFTMWWDKVNKDSHKRQIIDSLLAVNEGWKDFEEWGDRLDIAVSNLRRGIEVTKEALPIQWMVGVGLPEDSEVDLVSFGRFMESIGRKLPEGFPVAKDIAKPIPELRRETELLANPTQQQEPLTQPAHDSLDNPGGSDESKHLKTIALLLRYIENNLQRKQAAVVTALSEGEQYKVRGLGQTNLNVIFSKANKELSK
ncbi:MAG: hypothetical protein BWK73_35095 [Thiothrix lacustris]|uniref:Uncharacterized protein n=1 Tax=Thiothrix lacustris TaxID=525917 RepID=A0A1Y1QGJ4_9GAMM|nr:MAG: hypothetical protein BWK73_35095 [Thiothrix lacustris]